MRLRVTFALAAILALGMPGAANGWELAVGYGIGMLSHGEAMIPRTVIDDAGDSYDLSARLDAVSEARTTPAWLVTPRLAMLGQVELYGQLVSDSYAGQALGGGSTYTTSIGLLARRAVSDRWTVSIGMDRVYGMRETPLAMVKPAYRPAPAPPDPGIELGGSLIPVSSTVYGRTAASASELCFAAAWRWGPNVDIVGRLRYGFGSAADPWSYHILAPDGTRFETSYEQLPPISLDGVAYSVAASISF